MMKIKRKKSDVFVKINDTRSSLGILVMDLLTQRHPTLTSLNFRFVDPLGDAPTYHENKSPQAERNAEAL